MKEEKFDFRNLDFEEKDKKEFMKILSKDSLNKKEEEKLKNIIKKYNINVDKISKGSNVNTNEDDDILSELSGLFRIWKKKEVKLLIYSSLVFIILNLLYNSRAWLYPTKNNPPLNLFTFITLIISFIIVLSGYANIRKKN